MDAVSISITTVIAIAGVALSYVSYVRNRSRDQRERAVEIATIRANVDSLRLEIEEVKSDIKDDDTKFDKRMDKIELKLDKLNDTLLKRVNKED